jgi:hypothetical protein
MPGSLAPGRYSCDLAIGFSAHGGRSRSDAHTSHRGPWFGGSTSGLPWINVPVARRAGEGTSATIPVEETFGVNRVS